jgi:hypothetical protein
VIFNYTTYVAVSGRGRSAIDRLWRSHEMAVYMSRARKRVFQVLIVVVTYLVPLSNSVDGASLSVGGGEMMK